MTHTSQLHLWSAPLRRRIIQSQLDKPTNLADRNLPDSDKQPLFGHMFCFAAHCLQKGVMILPIIRYTGGAQRAGHRSAATFQQHSRKDCEKTLPASSVPDAAENFTPLFYYPEQRPCSTRDASSKRIVPGKTILTDDTRGCVTQFPATAQPLNLLRKCRKVEFFSQRPLWAHLNPHYADRPRPFLLRSH